MLGIGIAIRRRVIHCRLGLLHPPPGYVFLAGRGGVLLTGANGAYLLGRA
jgi:hypothetical protein